MTEKENMQLLYKHEIPAWLPNNFQANKLFGPSCINCNGSFDPNGKHVDCFGVPWVVDDVAPIGGAIPDPHFHLLDDICDWEEVVKFPNVDEMNWSESVRRDMAGIDRNEHFIITNLEEGNFNRLQALMGTCEAMIAMLEEPEATADFFEAHTDWIIKLMKKAKEHYNLDIFLLGDDICSSTGLLFGREMYDELILPYQKKLAKAALELDMVLAHHVCGNCEEIIPDIIDYGTTVIETMQPYQNDIKKMKDLYGKKVVFNGGWDSYGPHNEVNATEDMIRGEVRRIVDEYFYDGNFIMYGGCMYPASVPMEIFIEHNSWVDDELRTYSQAYIKKHFG